MFVPNKFSVVGKIQEYLIKYTLYIKVTLCLISVIDEEKKMSEEKKVHVNKLKEMKEEDYRNVASKSLKMEPLTAIGKIVRLDNGWL